MIIHPVRSRGDSFDRRVSREKRKSLVFSGLFLQNKVGEIHRGFVGFFNKSIFPLVLVGYEMTRANLALSASLAIYEGPYDAVNGDVHENVPEK